MGARPSPALPPAVRPTPCLYFRRGSVRSHPLHSVPRCLLGLGGRLFWLRGRTSLPPRGGGRPPPLCIAFKFHCLANHGYIWDFHPTSNQAGPDPAPPIEGLIATGGVVSSASKATSIKLLGGTSITFTTQSLSLIGSAMISARSPSTPFLSELKVPKSDIGRHGCHALEVVVHS